MRRDSPQASRSRHCRAGRLILSLLIPGCSVAGDQDPSRFPVRARCRVGVRNASSPDRGRDLPCRALGKTDSGGGWLRVQLEQPGLLLLRRLCPRWAEGSGGRHVRTHWFGHAHLPMRVLPSASSSASIWRFVLFAPGLVRPCRKLRMHAIAARIHRENAGVDSSTRGRDRSPAGGGGSNDRRHCHFRLLR